MTPALARSVPFGAYIGFIVAASLLAAWGHTEPALAALDLRWLYAFKIAVVAAALILLWHRFDELRSPRGTGFSAWGIAWIAGLGVFVLWINLDLPWATFGRSVEFETTNVWDAREWPLLAVRLAGASLVVPVMEELFWRSFVMRWIDRSDFTALDPRQSSNRALLLSSLVFGAEHHLWFAGILAGLAYGWLYRRSGNLWVPVVAHAVTNAALGIWVIYTGNWQFW